MNFAAEEFPNSQSHLHRIDPRIRCGQPGVRDVHVAQFETYVTFCAENMYAEGGLIHEVHGVGSGGNVVAGEEGASGEFEVRRESAVALEIPLQAERVEAYAVGSVRGLKDEEHGDCIDRIFEFSTQEAGQVRGSEYPSVAQACVEDAGIATSAADGVAAACPYLDFVAALFGGGLSQAKGRCKYEDEESRERAHKVVTLRAKGASSEATTYDTGNGR